MDLVDKLKKRLKTLIFKPKKGDLKWDLVEGFLGGVFFSAIGSYFIFKFTNELQFTS